MAVPFVFGVSCLRRSIKKKKKEKKTLKVDFLKLDTNTGYNLIQHLEMFLWPVMFLFCCKSKKNKIFNGVITI